MIWRAFREALKFGFLMGTVLASIGVLLIAVSIGGTRTWESGGELLRIFCIVFSPTTAAAFLVALAGNLLALLFRSRSKVSHRR